jgi:hypothetical protein
MKIPWQPGRSSRKIRRLASAGSGHAAKAASAASNGTLSYNAKLLAVAGSNLNMTRTPDCHFAAEARHNGSKMWIVSPDFSQVSKYADEWVAINAGVALGESVLETRPRPSVTGLRWTRLAKAVLTSATLPERDLTRAEAKLPCRAFFLLPCA